MKSETPPFGAEMSLTEALDYPAEVLRRRICHSRVLVLRSSTFDLEKYCRLLLSLGRPVHHILDQFCAPDHREVLRISNLYVDGRPTGVHEGGGYWHTDMAYRTDNTVFTSLHAERTPPSGGETEFLDCEAVLPALRQHVTKQSTLRNLGLDEAMVVHAFGNRDVRRNARANVQQLDGRQAMQVSQRVQHPLIVRNPVTHRQSLYGIAATSVEISGMDADGSRELLDAILDFVLERAPRYSHHYRVGDIVIWDNLSTLHRGPDIAGTDDVRQCRLLHRINVNYIP